MSDKPTITILLEQYDQQRDALRAAGEQVAQLTKQLAAQRLEDPKTKELTVIVRAALEVVGFATANLSPEIVKRWPYLALVSIAQNLQYLPDYNSHDQEFAAELIKIAGECRQWELKRANSVERYVPPPAPDGKPQAPYGYVMSDAEKVAMEEVGTKARLASMSLLPANPGAELPTKHSDDPAPPVAAQPITEAIDQFHEFEASTDDDCVRCRQPKDHHKHNPLGLKGLDTSPYTGEPQTESQS